MEFPNNVIWFPYEEAKFNGTLNSKSCRIPKLVFPQLIQKNVADF